MDDALFREILDDTAELVRRAGQKRGGTLMIGISPETLDALEAIGAHVSAPEAATDSTTDDREADLSAIAAEVAACTKCGLCKERTQTVFADGSPYAEILFVGEGPGEQEDKRGIPFVGPAGQLLSEIIENPKSMNLDRQRDTYICNVVKCRPPGNRAPSPEEMAQCEPYLIRQIELVKPRVIVALGGTAANALLKSAQSVGSLRERWHRYNGIPLRVTYHPSYLLRSPGEKGKAWKDIQEVMKFLEGKIRIEE